MKTTLTVKLTLPTIEFFGDYHEGFWRAEELNNMGFKEKIKFKEVGFDGLYWFIFYVGKLPSSKEIKRSLKQLNFNQ